MVPMSSNTAVPGFETIIGQPFALRILRRFLDQGMIPHALLFTGMEGVGKRTTARTLGMALNCRAGRGAPDDESAAGTDRPCGRCASCRQIQAGNHPDIIQVAPVKGILRIDQIRGVLAAVAMKPFSAEQRVVILSNAQTLNAEAGNALLKVLEEPPEDTILILTAIQKSDLLPTIVSRCRHIRFNPLPSAELAQLLIKREGLDSQRSEIIAEASGGSYTAALTLAADQWSEHRDWVVGAAQLDCTRAQRQGSTTLALAFAAELARQKEKTVPRLETLKTWIRDLSIWPYEPRCIINKDRERMLQAARADLDDGTLLHLWQAVEKAQKDIQANGNLRLTLDVMALRMARLLAV
jgi:DNA polymerase III subunit delta'